MVTVEKLLADKGYAIWSVAPEDTVYHAIQLLAEKDIGALAVLSAGKLVGIFSERDYTRKVILEGRSSRDTRVMEIMTTEVLHISPAMSITECMHIMSRHHFRHLPVVLDNELIGMISIMDVVQAIIHEQKDKIAQLENDISWGESY